MIIVSHRRNKINEVKDTPEKYGIEVDIRTSGNELIIHHDPFKKDEDFEEWIKFYRHKLLILNVKEEGLETSLLKLMKDHKIEDFFFLDQSFPFLIKTANNGEKRCAVRLSEYESIQTVMSLKDKVEWVWVDCFTKFPIKAEEILYLRESNFKLCLVSPELQGRFDDNEIEYIKSIFNKAKVKPEAVCTKIPEKWEKW